jgi:acyl dehydratase
MAVDPKFKGRSYGPYRYEVGLEKIREFAVAISSASLPYEAARHSPKQLRPIYHDLEAGQASRHKSVVAPPTFCVNFAMAPFLESVVDPELGIDLPMLLHGEQVFEFLDVVRPGDVMTTTGRITDIYERAQKDFVIVVSESKNQTGQLVVRGTWTAIVRRG